MAQAAEGVEEGLAAATARLAAYEARPGEEEPPGAEAFYPKAARLVDMSACRRTVHAGPHDMSSHMEHNTAAGSDIMRLMTFSPRQKLCVRTSRHQLLEVFAQICWHDSRPGSMWIPKYVCVCAQSWRPHARNVRRPGSLWQR